MRELRTWLGCALFVGLLGCDDGAGIEVVEAGRYWAELSVAAPSTATDPPGWFMYRTVGATGWDDGAATRALPTVADPSRVRGFLIGLAPGTDYEARFCTHDADVDAPHCDGAVTVAFRTAAPSSLSFIGIDPSSTRHLAREDGSRFVPWGNNFVSVTSAEPHQLIELVMYDAAGLARVDEDLARLENLAPPDGEANVIRMHLQLHRFLLDAVTPDIEALARYAHVIELAEDHGLYVMVTGLNYFFPGDNPQWVAAQNEVEHWDTQALWWQSMSGALRHSPGVFAFDLMNEPYVTGAGSSGGLVHWTTVAPDAYCDYGADPERGIHGTCFGQYVSPGLDGRTADEVAAQWTTRMVEAIRYRDGVDHDARHLITIGVGAFGLSNQFHSAAGVRAQLDFLSPHLYPDADSADNAIALAADLAALTDKPIIAGETFTFGPADTLIRDACVAGTVQGWIGQYDGRRFGDPCPPERDVFGCALFDAWYAIQRDFGPAIRAGECPP